MLTLIRWHTPAHTAHRYSTPAQPVIPPKTWQPAIELRDTSTAVILRAALPGVDRDQLEIQVSENTVTIAGEFSRIPSQDASLHSEFRYGKFQRQITLATPVQAEQVTAELKAGILTVHLPKRSAVLPAVIKVNVNGGVNATEPVSSDRQESSEATRVDAAVSPLVDSSLTEDVWETPAAA